MADFTARIDQRLQEREAGGDLGREHASGLDFSNRVDSRIQKRLGKLPEQLNSGIENFGSGVYENIADYLGIGAEVVGRTARQIAAPVSGEKGEDIWKGMGKEMPSQKFLHDLFTRLGVENPRNAVTTFAEQWGKDTVDSLAALGPLGKGAMMVNQARKGVIRALPKGPIRKAGRAVSDFIGDFGADLAKHPGKNIATEVGAAGGARLGEDTAGAGGALPGAIAGGGLMNFATSQAYRIGSGLARRGANLVGLGTKAPPDPLRPSGTDPGVATQYAKQQLATDIASSEARIQKVIAARTATGSGKQGEEAFRKRLDALERAAHAKQSLYWAKVPPDPVPIKSAQDAVINEFQAIRDQPSALPARKVLQEFLSLDKPSRGEGVLASLVENVAPSVSVQGMATPTRILDFISELRRLRKSAMQGGTNARGERIEPNRALAVNLGKMSDALYGALEAGFPGNASVAQARAYSKWYNDTFFDGPVGQVYSRKTAPGETLSTVVEAHGGAQSISDLTRGNRLPVPGHPRARIDTVGDPELLKEAQQGIDNYIQERAAEAVDPKTGLPSPQSQAQAINTYIRQIYPHFRDLPAVGAQFKKLQRNLTAVLARHAKIQTGAVAQFAGQADAQAGVQRLFNSADPQGALRELQNRVFSRFGREDGAEAVKTLVIDEVARQSGLGQAGLLELMNPFGLTGGGKGRVIEAAIFVRQPRIQGILREALGDDGLARLNRMYSSAARIAQGDERFVWRKLPALSFFTGRVTGAMLGRHLSGGGNLQTPALMSGIMGRWMEDATRGYPPEVLLRLAITDPQWEKVLMQRMPHTTKEGRKLARSFQRLISIGEGTRQMLGGGDPTEDTFEEE